MSDDEKRPEDDGTPPMESDTPQQPAAEAATDPPVSDEQPDPEPEEAEEAAAAPEEAEATQEAESSASEPDADAPTEAEVAAGEPAPNPEPSPGIAPIRDFIPTPPGPPQPAHTTPAAVADRPEVLVGAAFAGGLIVALILKRLAR